MKNGDFRVRYVNVYQRVYLVGGFKPIFFIFHFINGIILPIDEPAIIFQTGSTTS